MKKEEKEIMENIINRASHTSIPSHVAKELGFSDNWQKNISSKEKKMAVKNALKFKKALRKLSKS